MRRMAPEGFAAMAASSPRRLCMSAELLTARHMTIDSLRHDVLTRGLGWASAALGVTQLIAPGALARNLGVGDAARHRLVTRVVGAREMAAAAGLLGRPRPAWLW